MLPNDPIMLLSYVNTQLRDHYASLEDLSEGLDVSLDGIVPKLEKAGYFYNPETNRFMAK